MRLYTFVLGFLLLAVSAFAADIDGKWTGSVSTPNGDISQTFNFKADGAALSGSLEFHARDGNPHRRRKGRRQQHLLLGNARFRDAV